MLPPFIIEQIRKREEQQAGNERPVLELPLDLPLPRRSPSVAPPQDGDSAPERGIIVIDL
jgi:hypothetical protein